jgi:hypothetical protein
MDVYIGGKRVRLSPTMSIGKGGEADVFDIGGGKAVKVFKTPKHPDLQGLPLEQEGARQRLLEHQQKLRQFPTNLPPGVVTPQALATNQSGNKIVGYVMKLVPNVEVLLRYGERKFRQAGISNEMVLQIFRNLHGTVSGTHQAQAVFGDFNDLNILIKGVDPWVIDADSMQFGPYCCRMFTGKFVDPLLCDPKAKSPMLIQPHNADSDWYAFAIMLMQSLLYVGPFGGIYRPKSGQKIPQTARSLHRITVFDPEVKYPKPAIPYGVLPDELLQFFHMMFAKDKRGDFPLQLLENTRWTTCSTCGTEHARSLCPNCAQTAPAAIIETTTVRGSVTVTRIFETTGLILNADIQNGKPVWVYNEGDKYKRQDKSTVVAGKLDPQMRLRVQGKSTLMAKTGSLVTLNPGQSPEKVAVDNFGNLPMFDANGSHCYWLSNGVLYRNDILGPKRIGDVLQNQTLFWVGEKFGFGFYRAGNLSVAFVFDAKHSGIKDTVQLPKMSGQLVDATCVFSNDYAWFFVSTRQGGQTINQCTVIKSDGTVVATHQVDESDDSWLASIRGKCAAGNFLLAATDDGIIRVEPNGGSLTVTKQFPDTEPFVDSSNQLMVGNDGLYVVGSKEVLRLKLN